MEHGDVQLQSYRNGLVYSGLKLCDHINVDILPGLVGSFGTCSPTLPVYFDPVDNVGLSSLEIIGDEGRGNKLKVINLQVPEDFLIDKAGEELMEDTLVREQELVGTVVGFSLGHNITLYIVTLHCEDSAVCSVSR